MIWVITPLSGQRLLSQPRDQTKAAPLLGHVSTRGDRVQVRNQVGHVAADQLWDDVTRLVGNIAELGLCLVVTLLLFLVQVMS